MRLRFIETIILLLLIPALVFGETIKWMGYNCDKDWSWKDWTGRKFLETNIPEGTVICGSCFSQELPVEKNKGLVKVFPDNIQNLTFINCNLDNVEVLKPKWQAIDCSERNFKVQDDGEDWKIDKDGKKSEKINQ